MLVLPQNITPQPWHTQNYPYEFINDTAVHYSSGVTCDVYDWKSFQVSLIDQSGHVGAAPNLSIWIEAALTPVESVTWVSSAGRPGPQGQGDVNGDGMVTQADVDLIAQIIALTYVPSPAETFRADVNGDGVIDVLDIGAAQRLIAGNLVPSVIAPGWPTLVVSMPTFGQVRAPLVVAGAGAAVATERALAMMFDEYCCYARLCIQAASVVAGASWQAKVYFASKSG